MVKIVANAHQAALEAASEGARKAASERTFFNIGKAAKASELPVKTVRYYADVGLVEPAARSKAGYRLYDEIDIERLRFIKSARSFDFSVDDCRELLGFYQNDQRSSRDVKQMALKRLTEIDQKMRELEKLRQELARLAHACPGDEHPGCPILGSFARS